MVNTSTNPCPICGSPLQERSVTRECSLKHDGAIHTFMVEGLPVQVCDGCGEEITDNRAARVVEVGLRKHLGLLLPAEMASHRADHGLTQEHVSEDTGIAVATLSRWERGHQIQSVSSDRLLRVYYKNPAAFRYAVSSDSRVAVPAGTQQWNVKASTYLPAQGKAVAPRKPAQTGSAESNYAIAA